MLYAVKIVASFYKVQCEHTESRKRRCGWLCICVCFKFPGVSFSPPRLLRLVVDVIWPSTENIDVNGSVRDGPD